MTRKMKNCTSTNTPLTSSAFRASPGDRLHRYRCTMNWSVPCVAVVRNAPPITPDQKVYPRVTSKAKSKTRSLPWAVATAMTSPTPPGMFCSSTTMAAPAPTR